MLNYLLGKQLLDEGDHQGAGTYLNESVKANPSYTRALVGLADLHRFSGEGSQAEHAYRRVLATEPRNVDALFGLGSVYLERAEYGPALEFLGKAVAIDSELAAGYINLGSAHYALGNSRLAEESWRLALKAEPRNVLALNNLGVLAYRAGRRSEARRHFLDAVAIDPSYEDARANLKRLEAGER